MLMVAALGWACTAGFPAGGGGGLSGPDGAFSTDLAEAHRANLSGFSWSVQGRRADRRMRAYLKRALNDAGVKSVRIAGSTGGEPHLLASLPGRSRDSLLVVVPFGLSEKGDQLDQSSAALALELLRAFSTLENTYAIRFAFLNVGLLPEQGSSGSAAGPGMTFSAARARRVEAGFDLLRFLRRTGDLDRTRAVVVIETRAEPPLKIARDLRSHPVLAQLVWRSAERLHHEGMFPRSAGWTAPRGLQDAFHVEAVGPVLSLTDERFADPARWRHEILGTAEATEAIRADPAPESIGWTAIGVVVFDALRDLMDRFERVDAFAGAS